MAKLAEICLIYILGIPLEILYVATGSTESLKIFERQFPYVLHKMQLLYSDDPLLQSPYEGEFSSSSTFRFRFSISLFAFHFSISISLFAFRFLFRFSLSFSLFLILSIVGTYKALLDFEVCQAAEQFVGHTYSTWSEMMHGIILSKD